MGGFGGTLDTLTGGGQNNSRFTASSANILNPTTVEQANTAYGMTQDALAQQQALARALGAQGTQGMDSQTALTNALQQQMAGNGPNPALAQLAQATGANTQNQAALMAGQRGASGNVGLMARQAAMQGGANQQQAAGQAATLQAQQQLAAQQQLQNLASTQVGQQSGAVNAYNQAAQGEQGNLLNSINSQNNANVGMQSNINNANSGLAQTNANNSAKFTSGALNSAGGALSSLAGGFAHGGMIHENPKLAQVPMKDRMPMPDHIKGMADIYHSNYAFGGPVNEMNSSADLGNPNAIPNVSQVSAPGDKEGDSKKKKAVPEAPTGGPEEIMSGIEADPAALAMVASKGALVPGKAKVKGDSEKNDNVPAMLSPGEVVIPRHVMNSDDPVGNSAKFVEALLKKQGSHGDEEDDFKEALKKAIKSRNKK